MVCQRLLGLPADQVVALFVQRIGSAVAGRQILQKLYSSTRRRPQRRDPQTGFVNRIIGGRQINTIGIMQTGLPLLVSGAKNQRASRPDSTGVSAKLDNPTAQRWFDTTQLVNPAPFTFGNVGRLIPDVRTPGTVNWNLSFIQNTKFNERFHLQFRTEMFNFMNHVNLGAPAPSSWP